MTAKYTISTVGQATGVEYEKTTHCSEKCVWFSETITPYIHGEPRFRVSTLAKEEYTYDAIGRLTQVNETPVGKGCATRIYAYDEDSSRTMLTTRKSETETCATSGGTTESHTYDPADRLADPGVEYETFGDQTKIPAADAGEHEITASFYVDNQVASQKQNGQTTTYSYDPAGRTEKTITEGTTNSTVVDHYPGPGEAISWASEEEGKTWTRNVPGIDGSLCAVEKSGEAAVLQLHDLQGNIFATAALSESETKPLATYNSTEFGVQVNGTPPTKYSWLGASGLATEPSSAATASGGSSYVPQLGAPLQTEPITPPGAYANGSYIGAIFSPSPSAEDLAQGASYGAGAPAREAARLEAQREEAEKRADEGTCNIASCTHVDGPGEGNCEPGQCVAGQPGEGEEGGEAGGQEGGTFTEEGAAHVAVSGVYCGTFEYGITSSRRVKGGQYRVSVGLSFNFFPGYIPASWSLTLFVDGQFRQASGAGGTVDIESFSVSVNKVFTFTVPKRFPVAFTFYALTVEGAECQVAREHPDVEI
jgi:YD repeat-containing protein